MTCETMSDHQNPALNPRDLALLWVLAAGATPEDAAASLRDHGLATEADHIADAATRDAAVAALVDAGLLTPVEISTPLEILAPVASTTPAPDEAGSGTDEAIMARPGERRFQATARGQEAIVRGLGQWAAASRALAEEQADLERRRTDLLSTLSHELRTPLTLILTSSGLLLDGDPDPEMRLRLLTNVKQSADRMSSLVTDVLDLARLSSHRLELQLRQVNLNDLITGTISLLQPLLDTKMQTVRLTLPDAPPVVPGDSPRLERVLLNILGNANKFAPEGSEIHLEMTATSEEVTIHITDTGPGITPEAIPHLFEQFFTERTSSSRHNIGAGMGLPIAKGIVETHGGRIWVTSEVGQGTTVSFTLPATWDQGTPE